MVESQAHRGPDGRGIRVAGEVVLGHLRLSILDPSPAGEQPMCRGGLTLVHNGEVYNYLELADELRRAGHRIDSGTDTEVMLAAYQEWGLDAVPRFNGMFAFALWDADRRRLVLGRDRVGVKPLYVRRTARSLAFASEVKAFLRSRPLDETDDWRPEPDAATVNDFLVRGQTDHSTGTFLEGVTAVPAAHLLVVEDGHERTVRYWGPPSLADDARMRVSGTDLRRDAELVDGFRDLFDFSVRLRLRSDVALGTCLSGGLDSSAIVMTVARYVAEGNGVRPAHEQVPRLAFHARFPDQGIDESRYAELVASRSGVPLIFRSPPGRPLLAAVLPVLRAQGEPYQGASINAQYAVMAAARESGLKVLLDGQGADELLGGYVHYRGSRVTSLAAAGHPLDALRELQAPVRAGLVSPRGAIEGAVRSALPPTLIETIRWGGGGRFGLAAPGRSRRRVGSPTSTDSPERSSRADCGRR